jgi:hypothetical protein
MQSENRFPSPTVSLAAKPSALFWALSQLSWLMQPTTRLRAGHFSYGSVLEPEIWMPVSPHR